MCMQKSDAITIGLVERAKVVAKPHILYKHLHLCIYPRKQLQNSAMKYDLQTSNLRCVHWSIDLVIVNCNWSTIVSSFRIPKHSGFGTTAKLASRTVTERLPSNSSQVRNWPSSASSSDSQIISNSTTLFIFYNKRLRVRLLFLCLNHPPPV